MPVFWSEQRAVDHDYSQRLWLSEECMVLKRKKEKDFFPDKVCPLVFLKRNVSDPCTIAVMANSQSVEVDKINTFTAR